MCRAGAGLGGRLAVDDRVERGGPQIADPLDRERALGLLNMAVAAHVDPGKVVHAEQRTGRDLAFQAVQFAADVAETHGLIFGDGSGEKPDCRRIVRGNIDERAADRAPPAGEADEIVGRREEGGGGAIWGLISSQRHGRNGEWDEQDVVEKVSAMHSGAGRDWVTEARRV